MAVCGCCMYVTSSVSSVSSGWASCAVPLAAVSVHCGVGVGCAAAPCAVEEGAVETQRRGTVTERAKAVLTDLGGIVPFLTADGGSVSAMLGQVTAALNDPIAVDTQTTDGGGGSDGQLFGQPPPEEHDGAHGGEQPVGGEDQVAARSGGHPQTEGSQAATVPWKPPLHAEQWSGSVPGESDDGGASQPMSPATWGPTDEDLLQAMEELERQQLAAFHAEIAAEQGDTIMDSRRASDRGRRRTE